jgi:alpha-beta hydrolase superfamily lysophospholipase
MTSGENVCFRCPGGLAQALFWPEQDLPEPLFMYEHRIRRGEPVRIRSLGDEIAGMLFLPESDYPSPVVIVCHGAGDWKENYYELCEHLAQRGVGALALDLHGHGQSEGERFCVEMRQWVSDIRVAIDFLETHSRVDAKRIGAFGLSSGGTAILEAALNEPRLKALATLSPTVRDSLPPLLSLLLRLIWGIGKLKLLLTARQLRIPLAKMSIGPKLASDPEINRCILANPRSLEAFMKFPFPGGAQAFFVNTLKRVPRIAAPTLVLWGEDDEMDPPQTGHLLLAGLKCDKRLQIIAGNGHVGHLDRNRRQVFQLTADWMLEKLQAERQPVPVTNVQASAGKAFKELGRHEKWDLLSPFLTQYGEASTAYATLQDGLEYFVDENGYVAYTTVQHPVLARKPRRITFSDPVCSRVALPKLLGNFLKDNPNAAFGMITESCAEVLREMGFKANCLGCEPELPIQTYNTQGNWKELDLIKRARNEVRREGILIREEQPETLKRAELATISANWIKSKKINDREIWLYARRPIFDYEPDVRKFVAYDREGRVIGFVFYDPMYRAGKVFGYSANIVRCDERRYGRLATAVHMVAAETFRAEGKESLNLLLAPFVNLDRGKYNDDWGSELFFKLSARFGNNIYSFKGLSFHKSKYRGVERPLYYASNRLIPSNDIYLAFHAADVAHSYLSTMGQLVWGMITAGKKNKAE